jgi:predicted DNA-binding ArsR family transcriptional regulator
MDYVRIDNTDISIDCGLADYIKVAMGRLLETANDIRVTIDQIRGKIKTHNTSLLRHFKTLDLRQELTTVTKLSSLLDLRYRMLIDVLTIG